jgi:hypothetical protein
VSGRDVPPSVRRFAAAALAAAALAVLAARGLVFDVPPRISLASAGRFWRASGASRLLNAPFFRRDAGFAGAVIALDRSAPLDADVSLVLSPALPDAEAEGKRRAAALVLAPRRVLLARGETGTAVFRLKPVPREGPP